MMTEYCNAIESIFRRNLETRYMDKIYLPKMFSNAVESLLKGTHIVIVTGFVVKDAMAGETDGPPGAMALAKTLEGMGKTVTLITDPINTAIVKKGRDYLQLDSKLITITDANYEAVSRQLLEDTSVSHLIAIERPSQAEDGEYYSMRAEVITPYVSNTDFLFNQASTYKITTIGIGDGGNEVGMGCVKEDIHRYVPNGVKICAATEVDYLIIAGVSNWGAYGICGALSIALNRMLLPENHVETAVLREMINVGAVDGFAKVPVMEVDGIDLEGNMTILSAIRRVVERYI